jgi:hypothetical protein
MVDRGVIDQQWWRFGQRRGFPRDAGRGWWEAAVRPAASEDAIIGGEKMHLRKKKKTTGLGLGPATNTLSGY